MKGHKQTNTITLRRSVPSIERQRDMENAIGASSHNPAWPIPMWRRDWAKHTEQMHFEYIRTNTRLRRKNGRFVFAFIHSIDLFISWRAAANKEKKANEKNKFSK